MAHIEKCKGPAAVALIRHDERNQGNKDEHIDPALKHLNYNLCERGDSIKYMNDRIKDIMQEKTVRKDAVKIISTIITCPQDLPEHEREPFLKSAYKFCVKEFGQENIVSAWVHRDEPGAQHHIHVKSVPGVIDKNTGMEKLSAKSILTRAYLKQFHPRLQQHVEKDLGHHVSIINGKTAGKNLEIAELKAEAVRKEAQEMLQKIKKAEEYYIALEDKTKPLEAKYEALKTVAEEGPDLNQVQPVKKIFDKKEYVQMPRDEYERLRKAAELLPEARAMLEKTEILINEFINAPTRSDLVAYLRQIEDEKEAAEQKVNQFEKAIEQLPDNEKQWIRDQIEPAHDCNVGVDQNDER